MFSICNSLPLAIIKLFDCRDYRLPSAPFRTRMVERWATDSQSDGPTAYLIYGSWWPWNGDSKPRMLRTVSTSADQQHPGYGWIHRQGKVGRQLTGLGELKQASIYVWWEARPYTAGIRCGAQCPAPPNRKGPPPGGRRERREPQIAFTHMTQILFWSDQQDKKWLSYHKHSMHKFSQLGTKWVYTHSSTWLHSRSSCHTLDPP